MADLNERLLTAIAESDFVEARRIIQSGIDLNVPYDQGASFLFPAILAGDLDIVRTMLEYGADPNFPAKEPGVSIYTDRPFELAMQARFLMDWERYDPIVKLLEKHGATDSEGRRDFSLDLTSAYDR